MTQARAAQRFAHPHRETVAPILTFGRPALSNQKLLANASRWRRSL